MRARVRLPCLCAPSCSSRPRPPSHAIADCFQDLYAVSNGVPTLNVYIREAEPCDVFDAGGMHCTSPVACRRRVYWHKNLEERALVASETKKYFEEWMGKGK